MKRLQILIEVEDEWILKQESTELANNMLTAWGEYTYEGKLIEAKWIDVEKEENHGGDTS